MRWKLYFAGFLLVLLTTGTALAQRAALPSQNRSSSGSSSSLPPTKGQVPFSSGENGGNRPNSSAGAEPPGSPQPAEALAASQASSHATLIRDSERTALTYSTYDLEVHLVPTKHSIAVHARLTAQNSSDKPLDKIALQLSSSLHWYSIQVDGSPATFQTETIDSDIDHTGKLTEAVVALAKPLAPAATVRLNVIYSGTIQQSSERLLRLGAPVKTAASSEWDGIGKGFTALRGFGNVIWFPVSTAPVLFGQGAEMFESVGKWKLRESNAQVSMRVLVEYLDVTPSIAFLNGYVVQPDGATAEPASSSAISLGTGNETTKGTSSSAAPETMAGNTILQVASFTLPSSRLGFSPLSLFVMSAAHEHIPGLDIYSRIGKEATAATYQSLFQQTRPLVERWLGPRPKRPVVLVDLPENYDLPLEERNLLFLPLQTDAPSDSVGPVMAHMLGHAYFSSPRPWLNEGVPQFMTLLWIEQHAGRATAIAQMESRRGALALAETSDPGVTPGQSLIEAWSDVYYRDKAANVLWMLRDIVGDETLARALQAYDPAKDHEPSYLQSLLQEISGKDLEWFFDDWVYRDRGLPDLQIASAYSRPILNRNSAGTNYLVSVEVKNNSFCAAEVPVTVESASSSQTKELLVPAHSNAVLRVLADSIPKRVIVNDGSVPEVESSRHEQAIVAAP